MKMIPVSSSMISFVGYDEELSTLRVVFLDDSVYDYQGVSQITFQSLLSASSIGSFFSKVIRNQYSYIRASEESALEETELVLSSIRWCQKRHATIIFREDSVSLLVPVESNESKGFYPEITSNTLSEAVRLCQDAFPSKK